MVFIPGANNYEQFLGIGFSSAFLRGLSPEVLALLEAADRFSDAAEDFAAQLARFAGGQTGPAANACCQCAPVSAPAVEDSCHPEGSLQVQDNVITTPGGYEIEMIGQYEWRIKGPDGKWTRIHGDPHVDESDRDGSCDWDFKRNSTFVLGDGTRINVTTVPGGAEGMTVTGGLEIISGNDRVVVSDIDKGKGQIGTVTQDGYQHVNSFQGDVFVMGRETDDWSHTGKEIIGSENGGESFKLGNELHPAAGRPIRFDEGYMWAMSLFEGFFNSWSDSWRPNPLGANPYYNEGSRPVRVGDDGCRNYDRARHLKALAQAFQVFGEMLGVLSRLYSLSEQFSVGRYQHRQMLMA